MSSSQSKSGMPYVSSNQSTEIEAPETISETEVGHEKVKTLLPPRNQKEGRKYVQRNKRRRAGYWQHFWEYEDEEGKSRAECMYCENKTFACDGNINGSKNVKNHWDKCLANPANKVKGKQNELVFETIDGEEGEARLKSYNLDVVEVRKALIYMIIVDELPFRFVEKPGFRHLMSVACPRFIMPSRHTITRHCYELYLSERTRLRDLLRTSSSRVSITTDSWTSIQKINYMCLTTHFIDKDWKLHKKILNFCPISSHKGEAIAKSLEECLIAWGLEDKLFTVTIDNASSNDVACSNLRKVVLKKKDCISDGKLLHMRCVAHIINLIVWDGLKIEETKRCVNTIRGAVKYVRNSPARLKQFKDLAEKHKVGCNLSLSLDVPTRWNSTYTMLDTALKYQDIFWRMNIPIDSTSGYFGAPLDDDWVLVKRLVVFLKEFKLLTDRVSGSLYVTSNSCFFYIGHALDMLNKWTGSNDVEFKKMAITMKDKYDKYWGNIEKMNVLIYMGAILDPKVKIKGIMFAFRRMYGIEKGEILVSQVKKEACDLFDDYKRIYAHLVPQSGQNCDMLELDIGMSSSPPSQSSMLDFKKTIEDEVIMSGCDSVDSEFERYLNDQMGAQERDVEILTWWSLNEHRYPIVACMERDVLALPVSTVASESAFSTGGRHLDQFRSSLTPKMVQALICSQDWLRARSTPRVDVEETLNELEELEKDFETRTLGTPGQRDDIIYVDE